MTSRTMYVQDPEETEQTDHLGKDEIQVVQIESFLKMGSRMTGPPSPLVEKTSPELWTSSKSGKVVYIQPLRQGNHPSAAVSRLVQDHLKSAPWKVKGVVL